MAPPGGPTTFAPITSLCAEGHLPAGGRVEVFSVDTRQQVSGVLLSLEAIHLDCSGSYANRHQAVSAPCIGRRPDVFTIPTGSEVMAKKHHCKFVSTSKLEKERELSIVNNKHSNKQQLQVAPPPSDL